MAPFAKGGGHREAMTGDLLLILFEQSRIKSKSPMAPFFKGGKSGSETPEYRVENSSMARFFKGGNSD